MSHEDQGTGYDPHAAAHERQGRRSSPAKAGVMTNSDVSEAVKRFRTAVRNTYSDTLGRIGADTRVAFTGEGSWTPAQPVTWGDLCAVLSLLPRDDAPPAMDREAVARIIDPDAWHWGTITWPPKKRRKAEALEKANAIIDLAGTGGGVTEGVAQRMAEWSGLVWENLPHDPDIVCGHGMQEGCRSYWIELAKIAASPDESRSADA